MTDSLEPCRGRLERAREHLQTYADERTQWRGVICETTQNYDADSDWHEFQVVLIQSVAMPSVRFGVLVSDYLHQLRATLDNLVCLIVERNGVSITRDHAFPIVTATDRWAETAGRALRGLNPDQIEEIKGVQPFIADYEPRLHPLATLHERNRFDKHRLLTPVQFTFARTPEIDTHESGATVTATEYVDHQPLAEGAVFMRARTDPPQPVAPIILQMPQIYESFGTPPVNLEDMRRLVLIVEDVVGRAVFQPGS